MAKLGTWNPADARVAPEPDQLPPGVIARANLDGLGSLSKRYIAVQAGQQLFLAKPLHALRIFGHAAVKKGLHLLHKAVCKHLIHALIDARMQLGSRPINGV